MDKSRGMVQNEVRFDKWYVQDWREDRSDKRTDLKRYAGLGTDMQLKGNLNRENIHKYNGRGGLRDCVHDSPFSSFRQQVGDMLRTRR